VTSIINAVQSSELYFLAW